MKNTMKKIYTFLAVLFINANFLFAQNLVPNWSFEVYSSCPNGFGQAPKATGWYNSEIDHYHIANYGTDYMNSCGTANFQTPSNAWGYQIPVTGQAYQALAPMSRSIGVNYRENIYSHLTKPMV